MLTRLLAERTATRRRRADRSLEPHLADLAARANVDLHWETRSRSTSPSPDPAPTKLVANLPYNVATPIVAESLAGLPSLERWTVMVQREVADRFAAPSTKAYGSVSVLIQLAAERTGFHPVSRNVFRPPPNVDSALSPFGACRSRIGSSTKEVVEASFAHRRKTLPNSIAFAGLASREQAVAALTAIGRPAETRARRRSSRGSSSSSRTRCEGARLTRSTSRSSSGRFDPAASTRWRPCFSGSTWPTGSPSLRPLP